MISNDLTLHGIITIYDRPVSMKFQTSNTAVSLCSFPNLKNSVEFNYKSFCVIVKLGVLKLITLAMCGSNCFTLSDNVLTTIFEECCFKDIFLEWMAASGIDASKGNCQTENQLWSHIGPN